MSPSAAVPSSRAARAVVFATVCTALAVCGHALASACAVPVAAVLAGFGGSLLLGFALAGRERSLVTITGVLLGGQYLLHCLFSGSSQPGMLMHHPATVPVPVEHHSGSWMTFAHVGAALVAAWWLRRGERAVWGLARRLAGRPARLLLVLPRPVGPVVARPVPAVRPRPAVHVLRHEVVRRGPPSVSRALG
ncbi:hypothetical protein [Actinomadura rayongensis]|uniref:Uncharacterized protein n=1 Tax=Actinomadura rayongensis TaxID=1429076 RepID=A0A6I4WDW2_9ACTN|nr:hypothetical protein [Actinomadura rayongensis]MXQ65184.1 hypothetical protein [Actinomadura rayongensis]